MKENKKAIYAAYDIEFNKGKIFAPEFGWINPLLVDGNSKLGKVESKDLSAFYIIENKAVTWGYRR